MSMIFVISPELFAMVFIGQFISFIDFFIIIGLLVITKISGSISSIMLHVSPAVFKRRPINLVKNKISIQF